MKTQFGVSSSAIRSARAFALAFAATILLASESQAGTEPPCDFGCSLDKKRSVAGGPVQDSCVAYVGQEVTYYYIVTLAGGYALVEIYDDKLGLIGQTTGAALTRTTTLEETTTNTADLVLLELDPACYNLCAGYSDQVTVTVLTPTPTPTATPLPTPTPNPCTAAWPVTQISTIAKGQSPSDNPKVSHVIKGNIIDPGSLRDSAHRIEVCAGTQITTTITDTTGTPTNTAAGGLSCTTEGCSGVVEATEKYQSVSSDGRDKDSITFIPK